LHVHIRMCASKCDCVCVCMCVCVPHLPDLQTCAQALCTSHGVCTTANMCVCVCVCVCMRVYVHTCIHACICASPARSTDMRAGIVDLPVAFGPRKLRPDLGRLPIATMEGAESSAEGGVSVGPADKARTYAWTKVLNNKEWKLNCLCVPQRMVCFARGTESSAEGGVEYGAGGQGTQQWMNKVFNNGS
jgi:hypothetical protein